MMMAVIILLCAGLVFMIINRIVLHRELFRMAGEMDNLRRNGSIRQLTVRSRSRDVAALAASINAWQVSWQEQQVDMQRLVEEQKQSMADISHDLRTPLTALLGYLKLLSGEGGLSAETERKYLDIAYEKAGSLHNLVDTMFDLAQLQSAAYEFAWESVDVKQLLEQELASCYLPFQEKEQVPVVELSEEKLMIKGDRKAMQRILENLLQNALKHGDGGIRVRACKEKGMVYVEVSNEAWRLKETELSLLFRRSYRGDESRTGGGSGLGLTIVKEFVEQMNGCVEAEYKKGRLSMKVRLPYTHS